MDIFGSEVITEADEERFNRLSLEDQDKFTKLFSERAEKELAKLTVDDPSDTDLHKFLRDIIEDTFKKVEKDNWRGLPLLW